MHKPLILLSIFIGGAAVLAGCEQDEEPAEVVERTVVVEEQDSETQAAEQSTDQEDDSVTFTVDEEDDSISFSAEDDPDN